MAWETERREGVRREMEAGPDILDDVGRGEGGAIDEVV
jgi:hypothetical protein